MKTLDHKLNLFPCTNDLAPTHTVNMMVEMVVNLRTALDGYMVSQWLDTAATVAFLVGYDETSTSARMHIWIVILHICKYIITTISSITHYINVIISHIIILARPTQSILVHNAYSDR